jgi:hypothetical protein
MAERLRLLGTLDKPRQVRTSNPMTNKNTQLPPKVGHILCLAEIIREVDGNHDKGAAALAEAILNHPGSRWVPANKSIQ